MAGLTKKQNDFLKAYKLTLGNVTAAAESANISRRTFYDWSHSSPEFKEAADECLESMLDFVESKLLENVSQGKESSIAFWLNNKGHSRGYRRPETNVVTTPSLDISKLITEAVAKL
ncbi:MAG: hypothetical protein JHC33_06720 [Ignisphaera sp.]|nr:hypothetical protein [Ignisphaera sp.]